MHRGGVFAYQSYCLCFVVTVIVASISFPDTRSHIYLSSISYDVNFVKTGSIYDKNTTNLTSSCHLHDDVILLLQSASFWVLPFCVN